MELYAPKYYTRFRCIAHRCRHSCCIGWEIDIDDVTLETYDALLHPYGKVIRESIDRDGTPHFRLGEGERCPHLAEDGLCKIITRLGEGYLCGICREHPRFYHDTPHRREVGLGLACEEACRIILSSDDYLKFVPVGEYKETLSEEEPDFDPVPERTSVYDILAHHMIPYADRLCGIEAEWNVSPAFLSDEEWRELLSSLEYLKEEHRTLFSAYTNTPEVSAEFDELRRRALAYFVFRHASDAESPEEFRSALGLALFLERLLASLIAAGQDAYDSARIISEEIEYSLDNTETIRFEFSF